MESAMTNNLNSKHALFIDIISVYLAAVPTASSSIAYQPKAFDAEVRKYKRKAGLVPYADSCNKFNGLSIMVIAESSDDPNFDYLK